MVNNEKKYGYILGSVDLCNSTLIKSRFEFQDPEYKKNLYEAYLNDLYANEITFYNNLVKSYKLYSNTEENILSSLYVLKNIGDEFWFRIKVDLEDTDKIANIIMALYGAFESMRSGWITIRKSEESANWHKFDTPDFVAFNYKTYFDLVDYSVDNSELRYDFFKKNMNQILGHPIEKSSQEELNDLFKRLNIAGCFSENKEEVSLRTDMIGYQIDNFFRHTKYAVNHLFAVGERLFNRLGQINANNLLSITAGKKGVSSFNYFYWLSKSFMPKGISTNYSVYYLIEEQAFEVLRYQIKTYQQNNKDNDLDLYNTINILNEIIVKFNLINKDSSIIDDFAML